ncbi:apical membrane antigen 1 [Plasmodium gonderi]|uniref:Apical membrane antigen 1 n=1 Tax=Plasmodium gonderi TaxID=77519 RepID=A0A1Y1JFS3_PLAGO|nr:apical membrane antigen 1 [Plasmodium gonderi]GAW81100.1 apical membrane antigen 1 [Plasmodium gonderi]
MKKIYYILFLSAQYFVHISKCGRNLKPSRLSHSGNNVMLEKGPIIERSTRMTNPWKNFMDKYDIQKIHSSGIRVDLGEDVEVVNSKYRIPAGKCPVFGKGIVIENSNVSFLTPVATGQQKLKEGGFAFPKADDHISPITIDNLRERYKDNAELMKLDDISLCKTHASSFVMAQDQNTSYRHPAVYDEKGKICYMLYISAQENAGPRYCSKDAANKDSMFCFKPDKIETFENLVYLSKNVRNDWGSKCPRKNLGNAKFGLWVDGNCEDIPYVKEVEANDLSECNRIVFGTSASDQPAQYEEELTDYQKIEQGFRQNDSNMIKSAFLPIGAFNSDNFKSKGRGYNWGNFDIVNKKCYIFSAKPTCLINDKNFIATTALSHPKEVDNEFPCSIYKDEIEREVRQQARNMQLYSADGETLIVPRIFISNDKDSIKCPCEPEHISNSTCNFYVCNCVEKRAEIKENNEVVIKDEFKEDYEQEGAKTNKQKLIIIIGVASGVGVLALVSLFLFRKKAQNDKYDKMDQGENYGKAKSRKEEMLDPEASFWGEDKRASHTTPVLMEKPYY